MFLIQLKMSLFVMINFERSVPVQVFFYRFFQTKNAADVGPVGPNIPSPVLSPHLQSVRKECNSFFIEKSQSFTLDQCCGSISFWCGLVSGYVSNILC